MKFPFIGAAVLLFAAPLTARAGATLRIDETRLIHMGVGLRLFGSASAPDVRGAPGADRVRPEFVLDNALLGITGQFRPELKVQFNIARPPTGELRFLDAIAQVEPSPYFKVWGGRFLPPIDRASLIGPLFASTWDVPFVGPVGAQPGGRDDGLAVWGDAYFSWLRYQAGVFRGSRGESNPLGRPLFAGRLVANFLEPEGGYYHSGTTYGAKDVLSLGVGARSQLDGAGTAATRGDVRTFEADLLFEKKLPSDSGVVTVEGGFYRHENGGVVDRVYIQGAGFYAQGGYLLPWPVGPGRVQGVFRWQQLLPEGAGRRIRKDLNVNYVVQGHPLRFGLVLFHDSAATALEYGARVGAQLIL